ncbi:MAG: hypothetical protein O3B24_10675, partial [Verrucomicrobia bacterium]|nr:hypothetical protein [Verrucomicrobiota bacterium]
MAALQVALAMLMEGGPESLEMSGKGIDLGRAGEIAELPTYAGKSILAPSYKFGAGRSGTVNNMISDNSAKPVGSPSGHEESEKIESNGYKRELGGMQGASALKSKVAELQLQFDGAAKAGKKAAKDQKDTKGPKGQEAPKPEGYKQDINTTMMEAKRDDVKAEEVNIMEQKAESGAPQDPKDAQAAEKAVQKAEQAVRQAQQAEQRARQNARAAKQTAEGATPAQRAQGAAQAAQQAAQQAQQNAQA